MTDDQIDFTVDIPAGFANNIVNIYKPAKPFAPASNVQSTPYYGMVFPDDVPNKVRQLIGNNIRQRREIFAGYAKSTIQPPIYWQDGDIFQPIETVTRWQILVHDATEWRMPLDRLLSERDMTISCTAATFYHPIRRSEVAQVVLKAILVKGDLKESEALKAHIKSERERFSL